MYDLKLIDLGSDEAESDSALRKYFVKTMVYENALLGRKTIIVGRKGSGKSAIFKMMGETMPSASCAVQAITPDHYAWNALNAYEEAGIPQETSFSNAWKFTLVSAAARALMDKGWVHVDSPIRKLNKRLADAYTAGDVGWFNELVSWGVRALNSIKTEWVSFEIGGPKEPTPLRAAEEIADLLCREWPAGKQVRLLIDRLDDSWDASEKSKNNIIGLMRAANYINNVFADKLVATVFVRSDIYDNLVFHDKDKLRQREERLFWGGNELREIVCERVRASIGVDGTTDEVWEKLFSDRRYRSRATAEKYIIDRTFKRPRDIISFVRAGQEKAIEAGYQQILPEAVRKAEERGYSQSKFDDLIIEHKMQYPYVQTLLSSFYEMLHRQKKRDILDRLASFIQKNGLVDMEASDLLDVLFTWGVFGVRRYGGASTERKGGAALYFYYDDPSIRPLSYEDFYFHQSLRKHLVISEKRERKKSANPAIVSPTAAE